MYCVYRIVFKRRILFDSVHSKQNPFTMDSDTTKLQITKILPPNSGEPFVVETKTTTTTTTTTVTKRICVVKDANVDLTEIQALLDDDKLTTNHAIVDTVPPNLNVTAANANKSNQNATTVDRSKRAKQTDSTRKSKPTKRLSDEHQSTLLSSTKIENSLDSSKSTSKSQNKSQNSLNNNSQQEKSAAPIVGSPNLSKISTISSSGGSGTNNKTKNTKNDSKSSSSSNNKKSAPTNKKRKTLKNSAKPQKMDAPRSSTRRLRSTAENQNPNYIDDLIYKYISLDKKPIRRKKVAPPIEKPSVPVSSTPPAPPPALSQQPSIELPDLSAIYETSTEEEEAAAAVVTDAPGNLSPMASFTAASTSHNVDYDLDGDDYQMPISSSTHLSTENEQLPEIEADTVAVPLREHTKSNRPKRNLPDTTEKTSKQNNVSQKSKSIVKKAAKTAAKKPTQSVECDSTTTTTAVSAAAPPNDSIRSMTVYSPVKLYSPSNRARLRSIVDNKYTLSRRIIAKKLQNLPTPSKKILNRFDASHPLTIDADTRLIYYPNANDDGFSDGDGKGGNDVDHTAQAVTTASAASSNSIGMDFLMKLKQKQRPLLVKEIDAFNS